MQFSVGDKVKFLNDVGEGTIIRFEGDKLAYVKVEDGFEIPYMTSELLIIEKAEYENETSPSGEEGLKVEENSIEEDTLKEEESYDDILVKGEEDTNKIKDENDDSIVSVAFVYDNPNDVFNSSLNVYLINDTSYFVLYVIASGAHDSRSLIEAGKLEPGVKVFFTSIRQKEVENEMQLNFELLFFKHGTYMHKEIVEEFITINSALINIHNFEEENDYFNEAALFVPLTENNIEAQLRSLSEKSMKVILAEKEGNRKKTRSKEDKKTNIEEVDLHINEIIDDYKDLGNGEIVQIQLDRFHTAIEGAINNKTKRIVFIHGVGNGKLKYELRKTLDQKYPDLKYQDASFKEYGYGATMVLIQ